MNILEGKLNVKRTQEMSLTKFKSQKDVDQSDAKVVT